MDRLTFAAIADDDTGASDLAGMFADQGLDTLLILDLPEVEDVLKWSRGCHVVVMAEGTRMIDAQNARQRTRDAIRLLEPLNPRMYQIKYCSTFDSTEKGNIGPTIEAALDELDQRFTVAFPALPVNGRTTYMGYHFVHQQLLSDSPMRNHPLTPMTNPNLVDFLQKQTRRKVGLAAYPAISRGAEAIVAEFGRLQSEGVEIAVVDCLLDGDVAAISEGLGDMRLITGGSAPGIGLPSVWRKKGWLAQDGGTAERAAFRKPDKGCLIVAGSCSVTTRGQNEWIASQGAKVIQLDAREIASGELSRGRFVWNLAAEIHAGRHCLLTASATPDEVRSAQEWAASRGMGVDELGLVIARTLAGLTRAVLEEVPAGGLISAGGETSGSLCRGLELGALRVGRNIEPGVPLCRSLGRFRLPVVLKSGNFGSRDFYGRALRAIGY
jgi:uncharacterized protein YgbK (DUF1537 family)